MTNYSLIPYFSFLASCRKLDLQGIMIMKRNLVLKPIFMAIVRYPYQASCFYVGPGHFIPWVEGESGAFYFLGARGYTTSDTPFLSV
jgi:hypothetical protein